MSNPYHITCARSASLPRLAWCATVDPERSSVRVECGDWVDCGQDFFVEGAWNGDFSQPNFADALFFMGSGARAIPEGVLFSTASHTLEPLFQVRSGDRLLFSNSLAFLLAQAKLELDPEFPHYLSILASPRLGIKRYTRLIPTLSGGPVSMWLYCSIRVGHDGSITELARPERGDFADFADYKSFLVRGLTDLRANARSPERRHQFGLISTVSSGYDSPACAALAKEIGGTEAVTIRATAEGIDDSGTEIARHLGMRTYEFSREDSYANTRAILEFAASVDGDLHFAAAEDVLAGKLCLTGFFGDTLWGKQFKPPWGERRNVALVRADFAGGSLSEFRLRTGFIHVPVAMIGMSRDRSLWEITGSAEMRPWTLNNSYDRPIARRIAEEAGVPRDLFGQAKKVTATNFNPRNPLFKHVELAREFQTYAHADRGASALNRMVHNSVAAIVHRARRAARLLDKKSLLPAALRMPTYAAPLVPIRFLYPINENSYLIPWAVGRLCEQYRSALAKVDTPHPENSSS